MVLKKCEPAVDSTNFTIVIKDPGLTISEYDVKQWVKDLADDLDSNEADFHIELTRADNQLACYETTESEYTVTCLLTVKAKTEDESMNKVAKVLKVADKSVLIDYDVDFAERA